MTEKLYTTQTLADRLHVNQRTVERMARSGEIRCFRFGKEYRFSEKHIQEFLNKSEFEGGKRCINHF